MAAKTYGRNDLIPIVAEKMGISKVRAEEAIRGVLASIVDFVSTEAKKGEPVSLNIINFGAFRVKLTAPRMGRNPATGKPVQIPAGKRLMWTPSKTFKNALRGNE